MNSLSHKYWAFISYSHRDTRVALALQRDLETYRVPQHLVGVRTAAGDVPGNLKPIFRDRDELEAGSDLKASVRDALAQSRYLIVICSPDSARSPWVNQEIIEFKKLHGEPRVLALIAGGEPFASQIAGRENEECFPPAMRSALAPDGTATGYALEPIAADLRPQGDGCRRATLKLIAGMIGVGADELIQRDAKRRMRQLVALTAASFAGMTAMTVLAAVALSARNDARLQRNEAQLQRGEAEGLVEFMLGDLRKKLDAVGRLEVLDGVGEKARDYYARQDAGQLDANSLGRRSRALHLLGEIHEKRGQLDLAQAAFQRAADTTAQLLARAPNDGQRVFDHAQSVYWVGHLAWLLGQQPEAERSFREYVRLADRLVRLDPAKPEWQAEAAYARGNVAVVCRDTSRVAEALENLTQERDIWQRLASPAHAFDLANTIGSIAKVHELQNDFANAIEAQKEKKRVLEALPDVATNQQVQRGFFTINAELAHLELCLGRPEAARAFAQTAVRIAEALVKLDPQNKFWLEQLYLALGNLVETQLATGDRAGAWANAQRTLAGSANLAALDAKMAKWQVELRGRSLALAAQLARDDERPTLIKDLETYLVAIQRFATADRGVSRPRDRFIAEAELQLGVLLAHAGRAEDAATHWRAVVARVQPYQETGDLQLLTLLASAEFRLGTLNEPRALAARIESSPYRHPAFADLQQKLAGGTGPLAEKP